MVKSPDELSIRLILPDEPRLKALIDGTVRVPDVDLAIDASIKVVGDRFEKVLGDRCEGGEMCFGTYIRAREEGWPYIGLPVYVKRGLKHRHIITRKDSGIRSPRDLAGKIVGLTRYVTSPTLTIALIEHEYGVPHDSVRWIAAEPELYPISIPEFKTERLMNNRTALLEMLSEGRIDAAIFPGNDGYECFYGGGHLDRRLDSFPNLKTVIDDPQVVIEYYQRTGFYPVIHLIVIKESLLQENPGLAQALTIAFQRAKGLADDYLSDEGNRRAAEERRIIGRDPYDCILAEQDVLSMEMYLDCLMEQKLLRKRPVLKSLFAAESLEAGI